MFTYLSCFVLLVMTLSGSECGESVLQVQHRMKKSRKSTPPPPSASNNLTTIYVGYADNPFGASTRLPHKKPKMMQFKDVATNAIDVEEPPPSNNESRAKRGVLQLYNMVSCSTGCDPLIYKGYGCYCGFLGSGVPVDGIDRCCKMHDWCYDSANCPMYLEYLVPYYWKCYRGRALCAIDHLEWGGSGSCAQRLCECDRLLSECLSRFPCPQSRAVCVSSPWRLLQNAFMIF